MAPRPLKPERQPSNRGIAFGVSPFLVSHVSFWWSKLDKNSSASARTLALPPVMEAANWRALENYFAFGKPMSTSMFLGDKKYHPCLG